jgi:phosphatidylglycerophosphate synthase
MLDPLLRAAKDRALFPVARAVGPVPPNRVSVLAFVAGLGAAVALARGAYGWALALWLANRALDGLDGALARAHGLQSDFGGYLDILLDFVVYAAVPLGLAVGSGGGPRTLLACAALEATFFVNAASWMYPAAILEKRAQGAAARRELTTVTMPTGLVEGTETIVFYTLFILLPAHAATLMWIMAAAVAATTVQRLAWGARGL